MTPDGGLPPDCFDGYRIASEDLLNARSLLRRSDTKFVAPARCIGDVLTALRERYAVLPAGESLIASYRTLYYDTADLQCYHDHRRGRRVRHKVRVRHYDDRRVSFLEVKTRRNEAMTVKARRQVSFAQEELHSESARFIQDHTHIGGAFREVCRIDYQRIMLLSLDDEERVTIDLGLSIHGEGRTITLPSSATIEVKQGAYTRDSAMLRAARELRLRPRSLSKYCLGVRYLYPSVRANRILPQLALAGRG